MQMSRLWCCCACAQAKVPCVSSFKLHSPCCLGYVFAQRDPIKQLSRVNLKLCLETCVTMLAAVTLCVCGHSYLVACSPVGCGSPFTGSPSGSPSQGYSIPPSVVCSRVEYYSVPPLMKPVAVCLLCLGWSFLPHYLLIRSLFWHLGALLLLVLVVGMVPLPFLGPSTAVPWRV
jgi:hypothetical protein